MVDRQRQLVSAVSARGRIIACCVQLLFVFRMNLPPQARLFDNAREMMKVKAIGSDSFVDVKHQPGDTGCPDSRGSLRPRLIRSSMFIIRHQFQAFLVAVVGHCAKARLRVVDLAELGAAVCEVLV